MLSLYTQVNRLQERNHVDTIITMTIHLISCCLEEGNLSYPLGTLCIQSSLKAYFQECNCIHHPFTLDDDPVIAAISLKLEEQDVVGMSIYLWNRTWMDSFAATARKRGMKLHLFAGGPEATADDRSFDFEVYDFLILGEGELAVVEALKQIKDGAQPIGEGIVTRNTHGGRAPSPVLNDLPSPILDNLATPFLKPGAAVLWEMTRGCPFNCSFCFESRGDRSIRSFSLERLRKELDILVKQEVGQVYVLDPTFNVDKKRSLEILSMLAQYAPDIHFVFEIRAELLDEELSDAFCEVNCSLQIGLQSTDTLVLKTAGRTFDEAKFTRKIELVNRRGIPFGLDLIIGLPFDTFDAFTHSLDYAMLLKPSNIDIFPLALLPGTTVHEQALDFGISWLMEAPYTIISSPSFSEQELAQALRLKHACDLFFTTGQAGMWLEKLCEASGLHPTAILMQFEDYLGYCMERTGKSEEELDIFLLQESFIKALLKKLDRQQYLTVLLSFMELHQGIAFVNMYGENATIHLSYSLDDLALLDTQSLDEFLDIHPKTEEQELIITTDKRGQIVFFPA